MRLVILGGNRLFRESLAHSFDREDDCTVLCQAEQARACSSTLSDPPDITLVDLDQIDDDAFAAIEEARGVFPKARTVVLVPRVTEEEILACIQAGAAGFIRKEPSSFTDLRRAVRMAVTERATSEPGLIYSTFKALERLDRRTRNLRQSHALEILTHREFEVLTLIDQGLSNRQIAERLCLSVSTVKNHVHNILDKLEAVDRRQAVAKARENAWLQAGG